MKRIITKTLVIGAAFILAVPVLAATMRIRVVVNGEKVVFPDAQPYVDDNSRILIPVRFVSEELGAKVSWDGQKKQVTIADGETTVVLTVGQKEMQVNGKKKTLDTAASVEDTRTYVPLRFVSEALGAVVEWDSKGKSVYINNNGKPIVKDEVQVVERSGFSWVLQEGDEFKEKQGYDGIGVLTAAKFRAVFYEGKTNKLVLGLQTSRGYSQTGDYDKQCEELKELLEQKINATCINQVVAYVKKKTDRYVEMDRKEFSDENYKITVVSGYNSPVDIQVFEK